MKSLLSILFGTLIVLMGIVACSPQQDAPHNTYTPGLAMQMHYIQMWTHKLALSVEAENEELAGFYHHELEEAIEDLIESIEEYDGYQIADLTQVMLVPALDAFEDALDGEDGWVVVKERFEALIQTCNSCHVATEHGYIVINNGFGKNPFNQTF
jgi:hypothetical protein